MSRLTQWLPLWVWLMGAAFVIGLVTVALLPRAAAPSPPAYDARRCAELHSNYEGALKKDDFAAAHEPLKLMPIVCRATPAELAALRTRIEDRQAEMQRVKAVAERTSPVSDSGTSAPSTETDSPPARARTGTVTTATYLFDSKDSMKAASRAAGRGDNFGFLEVASQHGHRVEAGEAVIVLEHGWVDAIRVRSLSSGHAGWTVKDVIREDARR